MVSQNVYKSYKNSTTNLAVCTGDFSNTMKEHACKCVLLDPIDLKKSEAFKDRDAFNNYIDALMNAVQLYKELYNCVYDIIELEPSE